MKKLLISLIVVGIFGVGMTTTRFFNNNVSLAVSSTIVNLWQKSGNAIFPTDINWNVGIGSTTPSAKLSVQGNSLLAGTTTISGSIVLASSTSYMLAPRVGINVTNPTQLLTIAGSGTNMQDILIYHDLGTGANINSSLLFSPMKIHMVYNGTAASSPFDVVGTGVYSTVNVGQGGIPTVGTVISSTADMAVKGSGSTTNEYATLLNVMISDIGTGYTQSTGPAGRYWLQDNDLHGPINVQPDLLTGVISFINNYYNGSPSAASSTGMGIATMPGGGGGNDALHRAAKTYPVDTGLVITGHSSGGNGNGFNVGLQVGGAGTAWNPASTSQTKIGTGIEILDYVDKGLYIHRPAGAGTGTAIIVGPDAGSVGIGINNPSEKLSVAGKIESTNGGFKFPDGTVQTTHGLSGAGNIAFISDPDNGGDILKTDGTVWQWGGNKWTNDSSLTVPVPVSNIVLWDKFEFLDKNGDVWIFSANSWTNVGHP